MVGEFYLGNVFFLVTICDILGLYKTKIPTGDARSWVVQYMLFRFLPNEVAYPIFFLVKWWHQVF